MGGEHIHSTLERVHDELNLRGEHLGRRIVLKSENKRGNEITIHGKYTKYSMKGKDWLSSFSLWVCGVKIENFLTAVGIAL